MQLLDTGIYRECQHSKAKKKKKLRWVRNLESNKLDQTFYQSEFHSVWLDRYIIMHD